MSTEEPMRESEGAKVAESGLEPLVLIHGSGDAAVVWAPLLADLASTDAYALDLPGHGAHIDVSPPEGASDASVEGYAEWVVEDLRRHGVSRAVVCGHSLGSAIALRLALDYPELVSRLCLIGSGARLRVAPTFLDAARQEDPVGLRVFTSAGFAPAHVADADDWLRRRPALAPQAMYRDLTACNRFDVMARLGEIRQPTLLIVGAEDGLTPPKYAEFLCDRLPNATLVVIPDAGHYAQLEQPRAVAEALATRLV